MNRIQQVLQTANQIAESEEFESFMMNAQDFASQRGVDGQATTKLKQSISTLNDAAQLLNQSQVTRGESGESAIACQSISAIKSSDARGVLSVDLGE